MSEQAGKKSDDAARVGSTGERPLRVMIVSHSYVTADRRNKLRALGACARVQLVTPRSFREPTLPRRFAAPGDAAHQSRAFPILYVNPGFSSTRYVFLTPDMGVRAFRPDVIQVENEIHSFPVLQAITARRMFAPGARLVVSFWQNQTWDDTRGRVLKALQRRALPHIDFFLPANHDGNRILADCGIDASRRAVLPPAGVDVSVFMPLEEQHKRAVRRQLTIHDGEFAVAYCGRLVPEKAVADLVAAIAAMHPGGQPVRLVVIGSGPLEREVREQSARAGVNLTLQPAAGMRQVAEFLGACDAMVLPSRTTRTWMEQYGRVLVEAMACEVPVVGSDSGEIPRVIGDAGLVFPEGDVHRLATLLDGLRADPTERRRLGAAGRVRVLEQYSDQVIARKSMDVYRAICAP